MSSDQDQLRLDRMAVRYLEAVEQGDLDTIAGLWADAADDPEVVLLLEELNEALTVTPRSVRRRVGIGLAAFGAAACVAACFAALFWTFGERRQAIGPKHDPPSPRVVVEASSCPGGAMPIAAVSKVSRFALLNADLQGAEMPAFAWPFEESRLGRASPTIPAELLN
jgi:hypothetical protein